mmetsp:Transcript_5984/g.7240  ORF Transcript_5984/g.7240 Transcript_5984/m.7240 type:complete len:117 (-) Transcript_5984:334-684(-)
MKKLVEELECGICCELLHEPVLLSPCQHLNCGGCLSDWYKKEKVCPTCRVPLEAVFKSFKHKNLVEMVLEYKPELKRDPLFLAELNLSNIFTMEKYEVNKNPPAPAKKLETSAPVR